MEGDVRATEAHAPARVPAGAAVTAREFADLPFGGHAGEFLGGQAAPAPRRPQPLVIEPPPWGRRCGNPRVAGSERA